jgi:hypothetical protein
MLLVAGASARPGGSAHIAPTLLKVRGTDDDDQSARISLAG